MDTPHPLPRALEGPPYLTTGDAAARLGVSTPTVRKLLDSGELRGIRVGRVYRVARKSLEAYERRVTV